jgi:hypothetical protein
VDESANGRTYAGATGRFARVETSRAMTRWLTAAVAEIKKAFSHVAMAFTHAVIGLFNVMIGVSLVGFLSL